MKQSKKVLVIALAVLLTILGMSIAAAVNTDTQYLRGDANGDGKINVNDVTALQRHLAQLEPIAAANQKAADVDGSGSVDISDASSLQCYIAEFENVYHIGETVTVTAASSAVSTTKSNELPFVPN